MLKTPAFDGGCGAGTCFLRVSEGDFPPVSSEKLNGEFVFVAGDARVDEHSMLTSMHTLFLREHNRLCRVMMTDNTGTFAGMSADDMFTRARNVRPCRLPLLQARHGNAMQCSHGVSDRAIG